MYWSILCCRNSMHKKKHVAYMFVSLNVRVFCVFALLVMYTFSLCSVRGSVKWAARINIKDVGKDVIIIIMFNGFVIVVFFLFVDVQCINGLSLWKFFCFWYFVINNVLNILFKYVSMNKKC